MGKSLFQKEITQLNDGIFEVADLPQGNYDGQAAKYDNLTSSVIYNRIMWGNSWKNYTNFCRKGISEHKKGSIAELLTFYFCLFTFILPFFPHRLERVTPLILCTMLKIAPGNAEAAVKNCVARETPVPNFACQLQMPVFVHFLLKL